MEEQEPDLLSHLKQLKKKKGTVYMENGSQNIQALKDSERQETRWNPWLSPSTSSLLVWREFQGDETGHGWLEEWGTDRTWGNSLKRWSWKSGVAEVVSQQSPRGGKDAQWERSREFLSSVQLTTDQHDSSAIICALRGSG